MHRPSRWTLWLLAFAGVGIAFYFTTDLFPSSKEARITREKFERIQRGMTLEEVEVIMGRPPSSRIFSGWGNRDTLATDHWVSENGEIAVFYASGRVVLKDSKPPPAPLKRLLRRIGFDTHPSLPAC